MSGGPSGCRPPLHTRVDEWGHLRRADHGGPNDGRPGWPGRSRRGRAGRRGRGAGAAAGGGNAAGAGGSAAGGSATGAGGNAAGTGTAGKRSGRASWRCRRWCRGRAGDALWRRRGATGWRGGQLRQDRQWRKAVRPGTCDVKCICKYGTKIASTCVYTGKCEGFAPYCQDACSATDGEYVSYCFVGFLPPGLHGSSARLASPLGVVRQGRSRLELLALPRRFHARDVATKRRRPAPARAGDGASFGSLDLTRSSSRRRRCPGRGDALREHGLLLVREGRLDDSRRPRRR